MTEPNPFLVPTVVADEHGRQVDAGRAVEWWRGGWQLFMRNPGVWIALGLVLMVAVLVLGMIPVLGQLAITFFMPILGAGLLLGCKSLRDGGELRFDHLFAGFRQNTANLVMIGMLTLFGTVAIGIVMAMVGGGALLTGMAMGSGGGVGVALGGVAIAVLLALALSVPLSMAVWFAPALVVFKNTPPVEALKVSFFACLKNVLPFFVYGLILMVLAILASLPAMLGWLLLCPVLIGSHYTSYVDLFE
jgi:uncharacterized membrane protein